jgi:hypothetical protein
VKEHFDIDVYEADLNVLRSYYQQQHDYFMLDGAFSPVLYAEAPIKITSVLAEPYGYDEEDGIVDIRGQPEKNVIGFPSIQTPLKLSALYWMLFTSMEKGEKILYKDMPFLFSRNNPYIEEQKGFLHATAWVNGKKLPNDQIRCVPSDVYNHTYEHAEILAQQFNYLAPDLLIVSQKQVIDGLCNRGIFGEKISRELNKVVLMKSGTRLIFTKHPSAWVSYQQLYDVYEAIWQSLTELE